MSLAEQIRELEDELSHYQSTTSELSNELSTAVDRIEDLEHDCEEMYKFIEYIDKTHPELRTAYDASRVLEGAT